MSVAVSFKDLQLFPLIMVGFTLIIDIFPKGDFIITLIFFLLISYLMEISHKSITDVTAIFMVPRMLLSPPACNTHVLGRHRICWVTYLKEIIKILDNITKQKVSCGEMNVTNIFANIKFMASTSLVTLPQVPTCAPLVLEEDKFEVLCKAATVLKSATHCHPPWPHLEGIYVNLIKIIQKVPCPVKADNTIKLKHFLEDLKDFSKRIMKENYSRARG